MPHLRLAAAQLNTVVGDLSGNVERILGALAAAEVAGADLCVMPELAITGYPPEDLLLKPGFVADNVAALEKVAAATGQCAIVVGFIAGAWVGVSVCEDVWFDDGPVAHQGRAGADVVVNINASPYNRGRRTERLA